jgi:flavodoxin
MNILVAYYSKFGNTAKVAETIAGVMSTTGTVSCLNVDELTPAKLIGYDLAIMGTPTHRMNLPEPVKEVIRSLPKRTLQGTPVAAFDTSYKMSWFLSQFTASKPLNKALCKLGGKRIIRPKTFHVTGREGPLYDGEIQRAMQWAESILAKVGQRKAEQEYQRSSP